MSVLQGIGLIIILAGGVSIFRGAGRKTTYAALLAGFAAVTLAIIFMALSSETLRIMFLMVGVVFWLSVPKPRSKKKKRELPPEQDGTG